MTAPDYGKMCPNFCYREIQFNQSQAWTWSYLRASHCLWSNERPGICYLLILPEPEVRTHLPIIRDCHGAQIHCWSQLDIFFLLISLMTRCNLPIFMPLTNDRYSNEAKKNPNKSTIIASFDLSQ